MNETMQRLVADYCHAVENNESLEEIWKLVHQIAEMGDAAVDTLTAILLTVEKPMEEFTSIDWTRRECAAYALIDIRTPRSVQEIIKAVEIYPDWSDVDWDIEFTKVTQNEFSIDMLMIGLENSQDWDAKMIFISAIDFGINHYKHKPSEKTLRALIEYIQNQSKTEAIRMYALHALKRYFLWSNDMAILDVIKGQVSDPTIGEEAKSCIREIEKARKTKKSG
ncbi:MAG: hypothetical protein BroJett018_37970 [Chloroflexota bacterium]|nr:hypothetical protein [Chloroflexota bacterium]GIK66003.1 MAG: hypothetical protein BroJett018_37970 [Chloroflexota bacterium]